MAARAAATSTTASGRLVLGFSCEGGPSGSGTRRTRSKSEEERRESKSASFRCDNKFRSSMQKSLALLAVLGTTRDMAKGHRVKLHTCTSEARSGPRSAAPPFRARDPDALYLVWFQLDLSSTLYDGLSQTDLFNWKQEKQETATDRSQCRRKAQGTRGGGT